VILGSVAFLSVFFLVTPFFLFSLFVIHSSLFFSWPSLDFIKTENGFCSCIRASRSWGTFISVSLRRNRGASILQWTSRPRNSNVGIVGRRRDQNSFGPFPVESVSGLETKWRRWWIVFLETASFSWKMAIFNLAPELLTFNNWVPDFIN
jgi:hypothetical protein